MSLHCIELVPPVANPQSPHCLQETGSQLYQAWHRSPSTRQDWADLAAKLVEQCGKAVAEGVLPLRGTLIRLHALRGDWEAAQEVVTLVYDAIS